MPKSINRPRDEADAQQMQQGLIDLAEEKIGEQVGEAESTGELSEPQPPA